MLPLLLNSYILIIYSIYRRCQLHYDMLNLYSLGTIPDSITPSLFHRIIASKYAVRWSYHNDWPSVPNKGRHAKEKLINGAQPRKTRT